MGTDTGMCPHGNIPATCGHCANAGADKKPGKVVGFPSEKERQQRRFDRDYGHLFKSFDEEGLDAAALEIDEEASKTILHERILELLRAGSEADIVIMNYADVLPSAFANATPEEQKNFIARAEQRVAEMMDGPLGETWQARPDNGKIIFRKKA